MNRSILAVLAGLGVLVSAGAAAAVIAEVAVAEPVPVVSPPPGGGPVELITVTTDPITIPAFGQHAADAPVPRPPGAWGLKSITFDVVDGAGNSVPRSDLHLHHFVIAEVGRPDPMCDREVAGFEVAPLFGSGGERTPISFPDPYVMLVDETDFWGATWHLMNLTASEQTVRVEYTIGVQRGATAENSRVLTPYFVDNDTEGEHCGNAVFAVPGDGGAGSHWTKSRTWTMDEGGIIVGVGGHQHEGGLWVDLHVDDQHLCRSTVMYGDGHPHGHSVGQSHPEPPVGSVDHIEPCRLHDTYPAGATFRLDAVYDNSSPQPDQMGIAMVFVWHGTQPDPPPSTPTTAGPTTSALPTSTVAIGPVDATVTRPRAPACTPVVAPARPATTTTEAGATVPATATPATTAQPSTTVAPTTTTTHHHHHVVPAKGRAVSAGPVVAQSAPVPCAVVDQPGFAG